MQQPRQMYGLGSFVKKITKGVKGAVKGVKKFAKSDLGKTLGMAALAFGIPGTSMGGLFGRASFMTPGGVGVKGLLGKQGIMATLGQLPGSNLLAETFKVAPGGKPTFGQVAKMFGIGTLGGAALSALEATGQDPENVKDIATLKMQLANGYKLLNPDAEQAEIDTFVQNNIPVQNAAYGGRIGYAFGNDPEQNAVQASGIMGLPLNQNPAGATELDLRETGGFIPPVGVKEKEDDIPAMLSNNEFVFTADAVRGMGDGDVNQGAQRMYDMMKKLENGGRV
tara:strand:- start:66 stop:908 length:843 start_codon:yes stop_codon:yes gene_type:complete